ncbi:hypothetical protein GCM10011583_50060 [Streptomyces camponoticapitis]|uniref:Uncharacterized protein n=1 Tax=Streptomyces camponoticapitis TaxID=1616125 RepID=A0ABQ2EKK4_9ACTN|nr:hypothetical protein GCM10011583_50060 [Streptomyces camponoticapitis]
MAMTGAYETGYWCEATAHTTADRPVLHLGGRLTSSPRLAVRWLRNRVRDVTDQLDRHYAAPGRHWLLDEPEQEQARSALAQGEAYVLRLYDDTTCYMLSARPTGQTR